MAETHLPDGYTLRPARLEDAPAINALIRAYDLQMTGEAHHTEIELLQEWQRSDFHLDQDTQLVTVLDEAANQEIVVGYQEIWNRSAHAVINGDGYVHPAYNGRGIGTTMLRWLERRARQNISLTPPEQRVVLRNGVDGLDPAACELHEHEGYQVVRYFWHMEIRLVDPPEEPSWPVDISLKPFIPEVDDRAVFDLMNEAFQEHWGNLPWNYADWQRRMLSDENFDPKLWILAYAGDQIVGASLNVKLDEGIGWINQLGVRPAWRRLGLGQALLLAAFQAFFQDDIHLVRLSVDAQNSSGATRLYEKAGMSIAHRFSIYEKELRPGSD